MRTKRPFHVHIPSWMGLIIGGTWCLLVCIFLWLFLFPQVFPLRVGVAIIGDPYMVVSYDVGQKTAVIVTLPQDIVMTAVHGYGKYRLNALWSLDAIEKRHGRLFTDTLEENLGMPVRFYLTGRVHDQGASLSDVDILSAVQEACSFRALLFDILHPGRSALPLPSRIAFIRGIQGLDKKDVTIIRAFPYAAYEERLPDESSVSAFDPKRFSLHLETHAEDSFVRKETPRIVIYNTTKTSGLAQNVARLLEAAGGHVVSVGNDDTLRPDGCILKGAETLRDSQTAKSISWLYDCRYEVAEDVAVADFALYLGTAFEQRFLPYTE